jgi:fatty-acyl-CoA synthase
MFLALIRKPEYAGRSAASLRSGIIAGSPVTKEEFLEICSRFPTMHLQPSYGQTEASPCVAMADWDMPNEEKAVSAGKVIEHVAVRISDPQTGKELGENCDGEVQVRGYNVMSGYYQLPEANRAAFTEDGWLKTGDIGRLDGAGVLHITGRLKEMIIRAGENISPQEIEQAIRQIDWVGAVKVVGVPAEVLQEEIAACIIPKPGCEIEKDGLIAYLKPRLAHYKIPAYILPFKEFPMTASGKTDLKKLKEKACELAKEEQEKNKKAETKQERK